MKPRVSNPRNMTAEHHALTNLPRGWLSGRVSGKGIRGGTEIRIAPQYVADYVALGTFQTGKQQAYWNRYNSEPLHGFMNRGRNRLCILKRNWINVFIFEAKATRTDFLSTFGPKVTNSHANRHYPQGNFHWIVTPKNLIKPEEVPTFWGLLEKSGNGLREIVKPYWFWQSEDWINAIAQEILWNGRG